jgi:23S rRNA (guanosine2251-2'-O)-methyltransferase
MLLKDKNAILEAMRSGRRFRSLTLYVEPERDARLAEIVELGRSRGVHAVFVNPARQARGAQRPESALLAECDDFEYQPLEKIIDAALALGASAQVVALDHVQDPHNLGAILRTAAAVGAAGVLLQNRRCCPVTAAAYETSSGGAEHVRVAMVPNLVGALDAFKKNGFWAAGADERAGATLYKADLNVPLVWVLGAEGAGLHRLVRESCDFLVRIPTSENFPSLNVSVATGVLLFEALRQKTQLPTENNKKKI